MSDLKHIEQEIADARSEEERLSLLLEKSIQNYRGHPKEAAKWANAALKIAKTLKRPIDEARAKYRLGCAHFQLCEFAQAERELTGSIAIFEATELRSSLKTGPTFMLGLTNAKTGRIQQAFRFYEKALELSGSQTQKIEILSAMGNAALLQAEFHKALELQYQCLAILDESDDLVRRAFVLLNIANIYLEVGDLISAEEHLERSVLLAKEAQDETTLATAYYNLAGLYQKKEDHAQAREHCELALKTAKKGQVADLIPYILDAEAELELKEKKYKSALKKYTQSLESARTLQLETLVAASLVGVGRAHLESGDPKAAIGSFELALAQAETQGQMNLLCQCYESLATAYEQTKNLKKAVFYFQKFITINGEVHSQSRQRALAEVQARMAIEKSDRERKRMEGIAMTATARADKLREESDQRAKELTTLALQLVQKNEFLAELKEEIAPLGKKKGASKTLANRIEDHIRSDRDWETFENQFKQVHSDFLQRLSIDHPTLTPTELRIAALIKLNLPTKAIANLFCLSTRTVENHRQSIRRKLRLPSDANLVSYFTSL